MNKTNIKLNYKFKLTMFPILLFAIVGALLNYVVKPTISDIKDTRYKIIEQDMELDKRYNKARALKRMTQKLDKIEPQTKLLNKVFLNSSQELEFITSLEKLADDNNLDQSIKLGKLTDISKNTQLKSMPVDLSVTGEYKQIMQYILDLEAMSYYININSMKLSSLSNKRILQKDSTPGDSMVAMTITTVAYWR